MPAGYPPPPGPWVDRFEQEVARYTGHEYAVACNSGTLALILALKSLAPKGRYIVTTEFTCAPTVAAIHHAGYEPVTIDIRRPSLCMDVDILSNALEGIEDVAAVMPVALYGAPVDPEIYELCRARGVPVVEDACEAFGVGGYRGEITCFSFRGDKMITTAGTGGAIVTNDQRVAEEARQIVDLYLKEAPDERYDAKGYGLGCQMSNLQAAFGVAQIGKLSHFIERRRGIALLYTSLMSHDAPQYLVPRNVFWRYLALMPEGVSPRAVCREALRVGVETLPAFTPISTLGLSQLFGEAPVSQEMYEHGLCFPIGPHMGDHDARQAAMILRDVIGNEITGLPSLRSS